MTNLAYRGDKSDTHINNSINNSNTYNNDFHKHKRKRSFNYPQNKEIRKKIENKQNYIREFKTNNKTIKCRYCNHEVKSESINDETGIYLCNNCNYSIKIPIPKF